MVRPRRGAAAPDSSDVVPTVSVIGVIPLFVPRRSGGASPRSDPPLFFRPLIPGPCPGPVARGRCPPVVLAGGLPGILAPTPDTAGRRRLPVPRGTQVGDLGLEVGDRREVPVDAGEPQVGHL